MGKCKQLAVAHLTSRNTDKHTKAACITGASHEKAAICTDRGRGGGNFKCSKSKRDLLPKPQISWLCDYNVTVWRAWLLSQPSDQTVGHSQSVKVLIFSSVFVVLLLTFHLWGVKGDIMNQICKKLHSLFSTTLLLLRMLTSPGIFSQSHTCWGLKLPPQKMRWLAEKCSFLHRNQHIPVHQIYHDWHVLNAFSNSRPCRASFTIPKCLLKR